MIRFQPIATSMMVLFMMNLTPVFADQSNAEDKPGPGATVETAATAHGDADSRADDEIKAKKPKDPNRGRFLPIPVFITEPAIGEGLGLALAYFHRTKDKPEGTGLASPTSIGHASREQAAPPTVSGVFGAYTSNETAVIGVGHMNSFKDDHIRFTGLAAMADVYSTFYVLDRPFKFNLEGVLVYQETRFRLADSGWFLGVGLSYLDATNTFKVDLPEDTPVDLFASELTNAGLAAKLAWDTRDNTSMPNEGQLIDLAVWRYDENFGGDYDFWNSKLKLLTFHPLHEKFVLGARFEVSAIDGRAPFFAIPWVTLRGIPAMRYQGEQVAMAEIEGRYMFSPRWALIGFTGAGWVSSDIDFIDTEKDIYNYGLGARYKIFEAQNIWVGIDIARGPEETAWYIQVGHAW